MQGGTGFAIPGMISRNRLPMDQTERARPLGITLLGLFFVLGATMSGLAALGLAFPGKWLEPMWRLNPQAREQLTALGGWAVLLMSTVCAACTTAAVGLWRVRRWGYWTALSILSVNLCGDLLNAVLLHDWRTLIGLPVGGAMIAYLVTRQRLFG